MTKLLTLALISFASLALASCAGGSRVESASSDAVTVRHSVDSGSDASSQATRECQNFGKKARLRSTHSDSTSSQVSIYDCVAM
jgi:hypothetical protein